MKSEADDVEDLVAKLMKPHCQLMGVKENNCFLPSKGYSLEELNIRGKVNLDKAEIRGWKIAERLYADIDREKMRRRSSAS